MLEDNTAICAVRDLTLAGAAPKTLDPSEITNIKPFVIVPNEHAVEDIERMLPAPVRKRGATTVRDVVSFIALVNEQKTADTKIYGCYQPPGFTAVFNDHGETAAGWRDHTARYECPVSAEWKTWTGANGRKMTQEQFAQFIEDNAPDCVTPASADMIEISRTLEAKKAVNFASGIRLSNGQNELTYEEQITGTASKGKLSVPEVFQIGISVLEGGTRYAVNARLRYRIGDQGKLSMWFDLERPHKIVEDAVKAVWSDIEQGTIARILNGAPA